MRLDLPDEPAAAKSVFGLEGKRILVLGGGQGMGEASCRLLAALGAAVAVADVDAARAERVAASIVALSGCARAYVIDVLDDDGLMAGIGRIEQEYGPLDGMATIVGMAAWSPLVEMSADTWDLEQRRNLRYFFLAARELARRLLARGAPGAIVCVSSVSGIRSAPNHGAYGVAKAGLMNLAKTMAVEWSGDGIRVNVIASGAMVTPRIPHTGAESEARMMAGVPMHRRGCVDDIAKAVAFFLSDLSAYVTGQTLAVDGGFTAANVFNTSARAVKPGGTLGVDDA